MENFINNFNNCRKVLEQLNYYNLFLTGSSVLEAYGLNLHKVPEDLDVAIYQPTEKQMEFINANKVNNIANNEDIPDDYTRVTKLQLDGAIIDIIIEGEMHPYYPYEPLQYKGYNLQPVELIMQARARYARPKDYESCQELKNRNFNIHRKEVIKDDLPF